MFFSLPLNYISSNGIQNEAASASYGAVLQFGISEKFFLSRYIAIVRI